MRIIIRIADLIVAIWKRYVVSISTYIRFTDYVALFIISIIETGNSTRGENRALILAKVACGELSPALIIGVFHRMVALSKRDRFVMKAYIRLRDDVADFIILVV